MANSSAIAAKITTIVGATRVDNLSIQTDNLCRVAPITGVRSPESGVRSLEKFLLTDLKRATRRVTHTVRLMKLIPVRALSTFFNYSRKYPALAWTLSILWLFLLSWLAFLWNLGNIGLIDETEPLFAEASRQMTVTGDWITPYFNGATRFDKPPLIYWCQAIAYKIIGVNEWGVRLPSALSAIALTGLFFYTLRYFGSPTPFPLHVYGEGVSGRASPQTALSKILNPQWICPWIGTAAIAFNPEMIAWGRIGVSDMLLTGCMASALLAFFLGYAQKGNNSEKPSPIPNTQFPIPSDYWYLAFYVLIALAVLTKGPVGIVLPVLIIGTFLLYLGNGWEVLREMRPVRGILIILAIALPWYILVTLANGQAYINSFFGYHNLQRFTSVVNRHGEPWYFYFGVVLIGFAPWSVYLPAAIARIAPWKRDRWRREPRANHLGLFALIWFASIFSFFTIANTKLPSYVLPLMPASAIIVALLFSSEFSHQETGVRRNSHTWILTSGFCNVVFLLVVAGAILYSPYWLEHDPAMPKFRQLLLESGLLQRGGLILAIAAGASSIFLLARRVRWLWIVNLLGFVAFFIFAITPVYFLVDSQRQLPLRELAQTIVQQKQPDEEVIMIAFEKPSLVFYTQQPVTFFRRSTDAREYLHKQAASQPNPPSVLILGPRNKIKGAGLQPTDYQKVDRAGAYQLIRVPKQVFLE